MDPHNYRPPLKTYSKRLLQDSHKPPEKRQRIDSRDPIVKFTDCKATPPTPPTPSLSIKRSIADFFKTSTQLSNPSIPHSSTFSTTSLKIKADTPPSSPPSRISSPSARLSKKRRRRRLTTRPLLKVIKMAGEGSSDRGNHPESRRGGSARPEFMPGSPPPERYLTRANVLNGRPDSALPPSSNSSSAGDDEALTHCDGREHSLPIITIPFAPGRRHIPSYSTSTSTSRVTMGESPADTGFDYDKSTLVGTETSDSASVHVTGNVTAAPGPGESLITMDLNNASTDDSSTSSMAELGSSCNAFAGMARSLSVSEPLDLVRTPKTEESIASGDVPHAYSTIAAVPGSVGAVGSSSNTITGMDSITPAGTDSSTSEDGDVEPDTAATGADGISSGDNPASSVGIILTSNSENPGPTLCSAAAGTINANTGPHSSLSSIHNAASATNAADVAIVSQYNVPTAATFNFTVPSPILTFPLSGVQATGSMVQTQLDLGVATHLTCLRCSFTYNRTVADDCALHQQYHDAFLLGVPVGNLQPTQSQRVRQFLPHSLSGGDYVVAVDFASSRAWKDLAVNVLELHVDNDLGAAKTNENHLWSIMPDPEMENTSESNFTQRARFKVYLYVKDFGPGAPKRVVSLLLAERITKAFEAQRVQIQADEFGPFPSIVPNTSLEVSENAQDAEVGINKLWTHKTQRRRGYAKWLLETARGTFIWGYRIPREHIAWTHTTDDGALFVEYYLGGYTGHPFLTYIEDS